MSDNAPGESNKRAVRQTAKPAATAKPAPAAAPKPPTKTKRVR